MKKVIINNRVYQMDKKKLKGLFDIAKELVKLGIYAVEKHTKTKLKEEIRKYKEQGYKVYSNG